jgi:TonB family protein
MSFPANDTALLLSALEWVGKVTLLLAGAWVLTGILRRHSAALRHRIWAIAIVASLALPIVAVIVPAWHVIPAAAPPSTPQVTVIISASVPLSTSAVAPVRHNWDINTLWRALLVIWAAGGTLFFLRLIAGLVRLARIAAYSRRAPAWPCAEIVAKLRERFGVRRKIRVLESPDAATMPMTWGLLRPRIVLPASASEWDAERRRVVLSHEFAHIARCDWAFQLCGEVLRACFWFHPLAWLAANRLRQESEHACDDAVLNSGIEPREYAGELLALAKTLKTPARRFSLALALSIARSSNLERRFASMLNASLGRNPVSKKASFITMTCAITLLLPLAAATLSAAPSRNANTAVGNPMPANAASATVSAGNESQPISPTPSHINARATAGVAQGTWPAGAGRDTFLQECSTCHSAQTAAGANLDSNSWTSELNKMVAFGASISTADLGAIHEYLTTNFGPKSAPPQPPSNASSANNNAAAQLQSAGSITGVVKDPSGGVVVGATVDLIYVSNPVVPSGEVVTGPVGEFSFPGLVPGLYVLKVTQKGFRIYAQQIQLAAGDDLNLHDIALTVGAISQQVTINSSQNNGNNTASPNEVNCNDAVATPPTSQASPVPNSAPANGPQRVRIGGNVEQAAITCQVPPIYPLAARIAGITGTVELHAIIGKDGGVMSLAANNVGDVDSSLVKAALDAVKNWRYKPLLLNGQPVEVDTTIEVGFHLSN